MTKSAAELSALLGKSEKRAAAAAKLAAENEQWARKNETLLALAVKRELAAATQAQQAERRAALAVKLSTENAKWAGDSHSEVKQLTKMAAEFKAWAEKSDSMLLAANERIAELEKHLVDHREWALRSEAELALLKNRPKD